jgi:hypothetical protein
VLLPEGRLALGQFVLDRGVVHQANGTVESAYSFKAVAFQVGHFACLCKRSSGLSHKRFASRSI